MTTRKPIDAEDPSNKGKASARQAMWDAMRKHETFLVVDISLASKRDKTSVRTYINRLILAGFAEDLGKRDTKSTGSYYRAHVYRVVRDASIAPRIKADGTPIIEGREQMWRTMKMLASFTYVDLAIHSTTDICPVAEMDAKDYCQHLSKAGYLKVLQQATYNSKTVYKLFSVMNTGLHAPKVQRTKCVFDPNRNQIMWHEPIEA